MNPILLIPCVRYLGPQCSTVECSSSSAVTLRQREELTCLWGRLVYTVVPGLERNTNAFCYLAENPMTLETWVLAPPAGLT